MSVYQSSSRQEDSSGSSPPPSAAATRWAARGDPGADGEAAALLPPLARSAWLDAWEGEAAAAAVGSPLVLAALPSSVARAVTAA